jgi:zinc/manganese transport system substrate-binding protein
MRTSTIQSPKGHSLRGSSLRSLLLTIVGVLLPLVMLGSPATAQVPPADPPKVVVTNSILADLVKQVGGDRVEMTVLVGPNGDAHSYEPVPKDSVRLREAALVFENGLGFDAWIGDLFESSGSQAKRVVASKRVKVRQPPAGPNGERPTCSHGHHSCGGDQDPHVWHDVRNAVLMVEEIADALIAADPAYAASYGLNRDAYIKELKTLDGWIDERVKTIPSKRRVIVTGHDTFGYFADRYGFRTMNVLGSVSTGVGDPSATDVAKVVEQVKQIGVPAVFSENILNPKKTELVARQAGVKVARLYTDALGERDSPAPNYIALMRHNVTTMVDALR